MINCSSIPVSFRRLTTIFERICSRAMLGLFVFSTFSMVRILFFLEVMVNKSACQAKNKLNLC